jgi:hypothetical protein
MKTIPDIATACCWLGSLLVFTPFIGLFFLPAALLGSILVWLSKLDVQSKLVRGLLPLLAPAAYIIWLLKFRLIYK